MEPLQEQTAKAIVNIFETGRILGNYQSVTLAPNDPGHLTYGRSQATLANGNLFLLIAWYCGAPGATCGDALRPYLPRLQQGDVSLDSDMTLRTLLERAGNDPVMHQTQDEFFDQQYWLPATRLAAGVPLTTALGVTTVYDGVVHGGFGIIRAMMVATSPKATEHDWVERYLSLRRAWLADNANVSLHQTVYRMDELQKLAAEDKWELELDVTVRGIVISEATLKNGGEASGIAPVRASAQDPNQRVLSLRAPHDSGPAVELLQRALIKAGQLTGPVDGIYGPRTAAAVKQFQSAHGLAADGIVGPATWAALEDPTL